MCCVLLVLYSDQAFSHEGRPVYVHVQQLSSQLYDVRWKTPPVMAAGHEPVILLQGSCKASSSPFKSSLSGHYQAKCKAEQLSIKLKYPHHNPVLSSLIHFEKLNGNSLSLFNGPDTLLITLPDKLSFYQVAKQYIEAGFFHILSGIDHLLFVLCLLFITYSSRKILLTISGFTLGHSITLILASLEMLSVNTLLLEVLIALSIVMLVLEITKKRHNKNYSSLIWRYPISVAILFGLLHGFGFAGALGELGLPAEMKLSALVFFNMGVELGQLMFVNFILLLTILLKSKALRYIGRNDKSFMAVLYVLGVVSSYWFIDRSHILFFN